MKKISSPHKKRTYIGRRRVPRKRVHMRIGLLIRGHYYLTYALEIGEGGMKITSPVPLQKGDQVLITFNIPGSLPFIAKSTVCYSLPRPDQSTAYGVQFAHVDFTMKRKIRNFVASTENEIHFPQKLST